MKQRATFLPPAVPDIGLSIEDSEESDWEGENNSILASGGGHVTMGKRSAIFRYPSPYQCLLLLFIFCGVTALWPDDEQVTSDLQNIPRWEDPPALRSSGRHFHARAMREPEIEGYYHQQALTHHMSATRYLNFVVMGIVVVWAVSEKVNARKRSLSE